MATFCSFGFAKLDLILFAGFQNKVDERFISQDGKTYFGSGEFFGDFTLKVLGELEAHNKKDAGQWVCVCSTISRGILESR